MQSDLAEAPLPVYQTPSGQLRVRFRGSLIQMDGCHYVVPSMLTTWFPKNLALAEAAPTGNTAKEVAERFRLDVQMTGQCIRRNHPEVTDEMLAEHLDLRTLAVCREAIWDRGNHYAAEMAAVGKMGR